MSTLVAEFEKMADLYPNLTPEEELDLATRASDGDKEAIDLLYKHNAGRVLFFARRTAHGTKGPRSYFFDYHKNLVSMDDAICAASAALYKAIRTFNPQKDSVVMKGKKVRFTSWANLVMVRYLITYLQQAERHKKKQAIYLPDNVFESRPSSFGNPEAEAAKEKLHEKIDQLPEWAAEILYRVSGHPTGTKRRLPHPRRIEAAKQELLKVISEEELRALWRDIAD